MLNEECLYALIAEGGSEHAILDVLIKHDLLVFRRDQILKEKVLRNRSGKSFQNEHLRQGFGSQQLIVYRVLDSKGENFKLSPAYRPKVKAVIDLRTRPEIEMLFVIHFGDYAKFCRVKSNVKPSEFAKMHYASQVRQIKSYEDVFAFWDARPHDLVRAIRQYAKYTDDKESETLAGIIRL
jgi:hypothetical protein